MRKVFFLSLACLLLGLILGCGGSSQPAQPAPPAPPVAQVTSFAFLQQQAGSSTDWVTPMLGKFSVTNGNVQFTAVPAATDSTTGKPVAGYFGSVTLSPDSKKATFELWGGMDGTSQQFDIWVANINGTGVQVTNDLFDDAVPQFSPDGTKVVFASDRGSDYQVVIRNVDGTGEVVPPIPAGVWQEFFPTFSPDGTKIAMYAWGYDLGGTEFAGIMVMNADGSNPRLVTNPMSRICFCWDMMPAFATDVQGRALGIIFFTRVNASATPFADIYDGGINGTDLNQGNRLTDSVGNNVDPLLLGVGNGMKILFSSNRSNPSDMSGNSSDVYSWNSSDGSVVRLTNNSLYDAFSMWQTRTPHLRRSVQYHSPVHGPNWSQRMPSAGYPAQAR